MEASAVPAKAKAARKNYIDCFATLLSSFAQTRKEDLLAQVPMLLVESFDAARAELWLADDSSGSAYLVHSAGKRAEHRHDYATGGSGAIGKVIDAGAPRGGRARAGGGANGRE